MNDIIKTHLSSLFLAHQAVGMPRDYHTNVSSLRSVHVEPLALPHPQDGR